MLSRRNKYFLDLCCSQKNLNRSWHHLVEKIRSVLHTGIGDIHNMAEKTGSKSKESQGQKARCALALEKKIIHVPPAQFTDLWGKQAAKQ